MARRKVARPVSVSPVASSANGSTIQYERHIDFVEQLLEILRAYERKHKWLTDIAKSNPQESDDLYYEVKGDFYIEECNLRGAETKFVYMYGRQPSKEKYPQHKHRFLGYHNSPQVPADHYFSNQKFEFEKSSGSESCSLEGDLSSLECRSQSRSGVESESTLVSEESLESPGLSDSQTSFESSITGVIVINPESVKEQPLQEDRAASQSESLHQHQHQLTIANKSPTPPQDIPTRKENLISNLPTLKLPAPIPIPELNIGPSSHSKPYFENPKKSAWIMSSNWLLIASENSNTELSQIESHFQKSQYQKGLVKSGEALRSQDSIWHRYRAKDPAYHGIQTSASTICHAEVINLHLIRSCALLTCEQWERGLEEANAALEYAQREEIYYMECKSQLYRGLCLMELKRWKEASWAFTRAANVRGWALRVPGLKAKAERYLEMAEEEGDNYSENDEDKSEGTLVGVYPEKERRGS